MFCDMQSASQFPKEEYEYYMDLIKEIDPAVYKYMKEKEEEDDDDDISFLQPSNDGTTSVITPSKEIDLSYRFITFPSLLKYEREEQLSTLYPLIAQFKESEKFPQPEYLHYMALIKSIDPQAYDNLKDEERKYYNKSLSKTVNENGFVQKDYFSEQLILYMESIKDKSEQEQIDYLKPLLESYKKQFKNLYTNLPSKTYNEYMDLLRELDPIFYKNLINCEKALGEPCLKVGREKRIIDSSKTKGYEVIVLHHIINRVPYEQKKNYLLSQAKDYKTPITQEERNRILTLLNHLAPELYQKIIAVDPTGEHHILRTPEKRIACVSRSLDDGLPIIELETKTERYTDSELTFILAHELAHYILGHFKEKQTPTHKILDDASTTYKNTLPYKETFENSATRVEEYEADRFAIINLKAPLEGGLSWMKNELEKNQPITNKGLAKETFKSTHPLFEQRIEHLENLERDIEWQTTHPTTPIDWDTLINQYKGKTQEELNELL